MYVEVGGREDCARAEGRAEVRRLAAREVLRLEMRPVEVPEGAEVVLSPDGPEYADAFASVRLGSYDDLQILGFVPRRLAEEKVRRALAEDDAQAYELAGRMLGAAASAGECRCSGGNGHAPPARGNPVRASYGRLRKRHNPALARLLSDHYGTEVAWDSPVAAVVRKWAVSLALKPVAIVGLFGDITIHRNGTLATAPAARSLMAWNIWIHRTGRLVQRGSYLKVWANSVARFTDFLSPTIVDAARKVPPLWALND